VKPGALVAFEGLDGSGKSTQLERAASSLRERGIELVTTFEPTDGPVGRRIRAMARAGEAPAAEQELSWFVEDRQEHVAGVIEPALEAGQLVLSDRYTLSSVAYQGARGLDPQKILADGEARFPLPDLSILFEIPAALGLERVRTRGGATEPAFERLGFLERVAEIYASIDRPYLVRIPGEGSPDQIAQQVLETLDRRLGLS
jgi:dTMP kinase